jgi:hypothetical protein
MINSKILEIVKLILDINPDCAISGSVALNIQDIKTRREPKDIDIYLPYCKRFNSGGLYIKAGTNEEDEQEKGDNESQYERDSIRISGINIDIFTPIDEETKLEIINFKTKSDLGYVRCVHFSSIIKMKVEHAYGDSYTRFKHKDDIVFMMSNII